LEFHVVWTAQWARAIDKDSGLVHFYDLAVFERMQDAGSGDI